MGVKNMLRVARGNAEVFYRLYDEVESKKEKLGNGEEIFAEDFEIIFPMIMTGGFACEIYLKALLTMQNKTYDRKHFLDELYDMLDEDIKSSIENIFSEENAQENFAECLESVKNAFVEWRYFYEETGSLKITSVGFLKFFVDILDKCCRYHEYLEKNSNNYQ